MTPTTYRALEAGERWSEWETYDRIYKTFGGPRSFVAPEVGGGELYAASVIGKTARLSASVALMLALAACANAGTPQAASPVDSPTATATLTQTPAATCDEPARAEINLVVKGTHFGVKCLVVPAGEPLAVRLENRDSNFNHNFSIYTPEFSVTFTGDIAFPDETLRYEVPALEAGDYLFQCDLHPREMSGPLVAR